MYDTISRLKVECSRFLNVFLEIVIFKYFIQRLYAKRRSNSPQNKTTHYKTTS